MKKTLGKKSQWLFALLLIIAMVFSVMPISITAVGESNVNEDGYIEVDSIEDLYLINNDLTANYILTADIDLTEATAEGGDWDFEGNGWNPIGSANIYGGNAFSGEFDGNDHKIIGMRIDVTKFPTGTTERQYYGLFSKITGYVHDLTIEGGYITTTLSNSYHGGAYAGALAGCAENATIANIHSKMQKIYIDVTGGSVYSGGIVGTCSNTTITCCSNSTYVYSATSSYGNSYGTYCYVGGIFGKVVEDSGSFVTKCYNIATIASIDKKNDRYYVSASAGGIGGYGFSATIKNCYNAGEIITPDGSSVGIVYGGTNEQCYNVGNTTNSSYGAGIGGTCVESYYLSGTGNGSTGAVSLTKGQMLMQIMYAGFDFDEVWVMDTEAIYPYPQLKDNIQNLRVLDSVTLASSPNKVVYEYDEELNVYGAKINVKYTDGSIDKVIVTDDMVSGYNANTPGEQEITVTYIDKYLGEYVFTFNVVVKEAVFISVKTVADLYAIKDNPSANYRLENDIDITEATTVVGAYNPLGTGWEMIPEFSGVLDGNGYSIIGMNINNASITEGGYISYRGALFNSVSGKIINLTMKDVNIFYIKDYGVRTASIALTLENGGIVDNCAVYGIIDVESDGGGCSAFVLANNGTIKNSYNYMKIQHSIYGKYGNGSRSGAGITSDNNGIVKNCYNAGEITGSFGDQAGICNNNNGSIINSYNVGETTYAIAQYNSGTVTNCYYLVGSGEDKTDATPLTDEQMKTQSMYAGFDFENVWVLDPYANHPYPQLKNNIQDMKQSVEVVRVITLPKKTNYYTGDELDLTGATLEVVYISGNAEIIPITLDMVSGYDPSVTGVQALTVTFEEKTSAFDINVEQRPDVKKLTLVSQPNKTDFFVGSEFDFSGAQIKIEYDNGASEVKDVTVAMTTGGDINHIGKQTITITIDGVSVSFEVEVSQLKVAQVSVSKLPNKTVYLEGENIDLTGLEITVTYNNGNTVKLTNGYTIEGFLKTPGTHNVKVIYDNVSTTFEVEVQAKGVVSLELRQAPAKTEYYEGDAFDKTGIILVATYDTQEVAIIEDYTILNFDSTIGTKTVTLMYRGHSVSFTVKVNALSVTGVYIERYPAKTEYIEGEVLDTTDLIVKATYNNGKVVTLDNYSISGFVSEPGDYTVAISFEGNTCTFDVTVAEKVLQDVRITLPSKVAYKIGEPFDTAGFTVKAYYNNGQVLTVENYVLSGFDSTTEGTKEITVEYDGFVRSFAVVVSQRTVIETNGNVSVGKLVGRLGDTIVIPVSVSNNPGIAGFTHTITFNANNLEFVSANTVNGFVDGTVIVNDEKLAEGKITILWFGDNNVQGDGVVYNLTFKVRETATDEISNINIAFNVNDNVNTTGANVMFGAINGYVDIRSYWLGDLDGDREFEMVDLLQLAQYVSGKAMTLTEKQMLSADVNEDGIIDIHDVVMLNQWLLVADM